jgi:hypothetical protein
MNIDLSALADRARYCNFHDSVANLEFETRMFALCVFSGGRKWVLRFESEKRVDGPR